MHSAHFLTSLIGLAVVTTAAPQPTGQANGLAIPIAKRSTLMGADSVNARALHSHVESIRAKISRGFSNFERNLGVSHPSANNNLKRSTGAVPLTDDNNQLWYGSISVGTPESSFTVEFDTGSRHDFTVYWPQCKTCSGHTIYDPSTSSSSQDLGQTFSISLGSDSGVSGEQYSDTVVVAGLSAVDQTLGVATQYPSALAADSFPPDGVLGLAFQSISAYNAAPVFENLVSQGQTDAPVFSIKLGTSGELFLGGANSALYTGDFTYTPVTNVGFWEVNMDSVDGNGQTILSNIDSIIDTGSTLVIGHPSQVASFYQALGGTDASQTVGDGYYTFPCNSFPDVSFTFGGKSWSISAKTLNIGQVSSGSADCISGIVGQDTGSPFWVIGGVFLQNVYSTFDIDNQQVGFAQLA